MAMIVVTTASAMDWAEAVVTSSPTGLGPVVIVTGTTTYTDTYVYTWDGAPLELLRR